MHIPQDWTRLCWESRRVPYKCGRDLCQPSRVGEFRSGSADFTPQLTKPVVLLSGHPTLLGAKNLVFAFFVRSIEMPQTFVAHL